MAHSRLPLRGGCLCGAIRYEATAAPLLIVACHCRDCQKRTSSAYALNMPVLKEQFCITQGAPREIRRQAPSGNFGTHLYCDGCMSRLASLPDVSPLTASVRPGTLDDTSWVEPTVHIFARSALRGAIPAGADRFETDAPDWEPFIQKFKIIWDAL